MKYLALFVYAFVSASSFAEKVAMEYDSSTYEQAPVKMKHACPVIVGTVSDERSNKISVGDELRPLESSDPLPWLKSALQNLSAYGFQTAKESTSQGAVAIDAALFRSYIWHAYMRINGMAVVDISYQLPSGLTVSKRYRSHGSKTNMANGIGEYNTALNYAINGVLGKIAQDLDKLCAGQSLDNPLPSANGLLRAALPTPQIAASPETVLPLLAATNVAPAPSQPELPVTLPSPAAPIESPKVAVAMAIAQTPAPLEYESATKLGTWSYEVEKLAAEQGCESKGAGAWLVSKQDFAETYRVRCADGSKFIAVCDSTQCKPM